MSRYSIRWAVGVTARRCALASTKIWLETGMLRTAARAAARIHPVTSPIGMITAQGPGLGIDIEESALTRFRI